MGSEGRGIKGRRRRRGLVRIYASVHIDSKGEARFSVKAVGKEERDGGR